jgi:hypothetical protein
MWFQRDPGVSREAGKGSPGPRIRKFRVGEAGRRTQSPQRKASPREGALGKVQGSQDFRKYSFGGLDKRGHEISAGPAVPAKRLFGILERAAEEEGRSILEGVRDGHLRRDPFHAVSVKLKGFEKGGGDGEGNAS